MKIEILGSETLGVRGLSCFVRVGEVKVLIDPGLALGYTRYGYHPHPLQAAYGDRVKDKIVRCWKKATDIVISHLHGDHIPLLHPNPFQLGISDVIGLNPDATIWIKPKKFCSELELARFVELEKAFKDQIVEMNIGEADGILHFFGPFSHGYESKTLVFATVIEDFVHTSDTQLLDKHAISKILKLEPRVVFSDGPPVYRWISRRARYLNLFKIAYENALRLVNHMDVVIVDHHLMRCDAGLEWLKRICENVLCSAEFLDKPITMLESWRRVLYSAIPVKKDWFMKEFNELKDRCRMLLPKLDKELKKKRPRMEEEFKRVLHTVLAKFKNLTFDSTII